MKRVIQKYVVNTLSEKILAGDLAEGDTVHVALDGRGMVEFVVKVHAEPVV